MISISAMARSINTDACCHDPLPSRKVAKRRKSDVSANKFRQAFVDRKGRRSWNDDEIDYILNKQRVFGIVYSPEEIEYSMATAATINPAVNGNHVNGNHVNGNDVLTYHQVPETKYDRK